MAGGAIGISMGFTLSYSTFMEAPKIEVYLININDVSGNWGNPDLIYEYLKGRT